MFLRVESQEFMICQNLPDQKSDVPMSHVINHVISDRCFGMFSQVGKSMKQLGQLNDAFSEGAAAPADRVGAAWQRDGPVLL